MEYTKLANGVEMPMLGYGVFQIGPAETEACVAEALDAGYRLIDTAQVYGNEAGVGAAIAKSGLSRDELFIVDKVWITNYGEGYTLPSIDESLKKLGTDHIDLMLLHQGYGDYYGAWRDLEKAYEEGKVRAIGVSNFDANRILDICTFATVKPMVDQVETHVFWQQREARAVMEKMGVKPMAWSPFAEGANGFFTNPMLTEIGKKYGKSPAQVALRHLMDLGVIVIPKSTHRERMDQNLAVFDFELTDEDRSQIATLDGNKSIVFDHRDMKLIGGWLAGFASGRKQA
ncbi:MAG: aldo/keto reductase [Atopobiaceae bacterium]